MKILLTILLVSLIGITSGIHVYLVWKMKDYKMVLLQIGIVMVAVIGGIFVIYDFDNLSISRLLNGLSPFEKLNGGGKGT